MMKKGTVNVSTRLKIYFAASIIVQVLLFVFMQIYATKHVEVLSNVILERYGILLTLICIPFALKLFHERVKKLDKNDAVTFQKKYVIQYFIRSAILWFVYFFNLVSLYMTGARNFSFMIIVTIFALLLCAPSKAFYLNDNE